MMRVFMTGCTGFIGRNVLESLLEEGTTVYALVRKIPDWLSASQKQFSNLNLLIGDLSQVKEKSAEVKECDIFLHFAWGGVNRQQIDSDEVQEKNISDSLLCVSAARKLNCRLFMDAGSRAEYGNYSGTMAEDVICQPVTAYGKAKYEFMKAACVQSEGFDIKYLHLRFFSVIGNGDHPWSIMETLINSLQANKDVELSACQHTWNFLYIKDAVCMVRELIAYGLDMEEQFAVFNIASSRSRRLKDYTDSVRDIIGGTGTLYYGTFQQGKEGALSVIPSIEKFTKATRFQEKYTFEKAIGEMIQRQKPHWR